MTDSLEINKIVAAVLTAGVVAMGSGFAAEVLFPHEGHQKPVYQIAAATGEKTGGEAAKPAAPSVEPVTPLLASADPAKGAKIAKKCETCHNIDKGGPNKIGPHLWGVVGRPIASVSDFSYSDALKKLSGEKWTYEHLNHFIHNPREYVPGTKMGFAGLKKVQDRADVIAFLREQSDNPLPLPEPTASQGSGASEQGAQQASGTAEQGAQQAASEAAGQAGQAAEQTAAASGGGGLGAAIAAASVDEGAKVARKCKACHDISKGGKNKIGPELYGVVGREIASKPDFHYSSALSGKSGMEWTYENLNAFLTDPRKWAPGTKMTFAGIKDDKERAAVIAYLRSENDNPPPLP